MAAFAAAITCPLPVHSEGESAWASRDVEGRSTVLDDIVVDPSNPQRWFAVGRDGIYVSYRAGDGWRRVLDAEDQSISGLAFSDDSPLPEAGSAPKAGSVASEPTLFVAIQGRRVPLGLAVGLPALAGGAAVRLQAAELIRVDGQWRFLDAMFRPLLPNLRAVARDPSNRDVMYAATSQGVVVTEDGGRTWEQRNAWLTDTSLVDIRTDPASPQRVLVVTGNGSVFESTNGGRVWAPWQVERHRSVRRILRFEGDRFYAQAGGGKILLVGINTIQDVLSGCDSASMVSPDKLACGEAGGLRVGALKDGHFAGREAQVGFPGPDVNRLVESDKGRILALLNGGGALVLEDSGRWAVSSQFRSGTLYDLVLDARQDLQAMASERGLWVHPPASDEWTNRLERTPVGAVLLESTTTAALYAGTLDGRLLVSTDLGWSFAPTDLTLPARVPVTDLAADPSGGGQMWVATWGAGLFQGKPGAGWTSISPTGLDLRRVRRVKVDPTHSQNVWAAAWAGGLVRTVDGGTSWARVDLGCHLVYDVAIHPFRAEEVTAACEDGRVMRTADGGGTWAALPLGLGGDVLALRYSVSRQGALFAGTDSAEVAQLSADGTVTRNAEDAAAANLSESGADRHRRAADAERHESRRRAEAERTAARERAEFQQRQAARKATRADVVAFTPEGQSGARIGDGEILVTRDAGASWVPVQVTNFRPMMMRFPVPAGMELSPDGARLLLWFKGTGLVLIDLAAQPEEGARPIRSNPVGPVQTKEGGCTVAMDPALAASIATVGNAVLMVQGTGEWFSEGGAQGPWMARGSGLTCEGGKAAPATLRKRPRTAEWEALAQRLGLDPPKALVKAVKRARAELRTAHPLADGRTMVSTRDARFGIVEAGRCTLHGAAPKGAIWLYVTSGSSPRVYLGTPNGVLVSTDYGVSFGPT